MCGTPQGLLNKMQMVVPTLVRIDNSNIIIGLTVVSYRDPQGFLNLRPPASFHLTFIHSYIHHQRYAIVQPDKTTNSIRIYIHEHTTDEECSIPIQYCFCFSKKDHSEIG